MTTQHIDATEFQQALADCRSSSGESLLELSSRGKVLVVFLRHAGCTFCREALSDVSRQRKEIEATGATIALVHMVSDDRARELFQEYGLEDLPRFSDPEQKLYEAFELGQGSLSQLFGPQVIMRGLRAALFERHGFGMIEGNALRMPGAFVLEHGKIVQAFRHKTAGDRPDYCAMASGS